jgi:hypothetical protein
LAKADQAYHKRVLYITANEITLARWLAKKTIKAKLQRQGVRLQSIPAADVSRAGEAYFIEHFRELIVEAKALSVAFENNRRAKLRTYATIVLARTDDVGSEHRQGVSGSAGSQSSGHSKSNL